MSGKSGMDQHGPDAASGMLKRSHLRLQRHVTSQWQCHRRPGNLWRALVMFSCSHVCIDFHVVILQAIGHLKKVAMACLGHEVHRLVKSINEYRCRSVSILSICSLCVCLGWRVRRCPSGFLSTFKKGHTPSKAPM